MIKQRLKDEDEIKVKIGQRIRDLRIEKGLSQESLSFEAGLHRNYISDVERGTRNIAIVALNKIAMALEVSLKELFDI